MLNATSVPKGEIVSRTVCFDASGKNSIGICSDGETVEGLYYYDLSTDTYEKESIIYNGKELSLWRFCEIY